MSAPSAESAVIVAGIVGLFIGAWSVVRSEKRRTEALRDEILQAVEKADAAETHQHVAIHVDGDLDGAELAARVKAFRIRTGRTPRAGRYR